MTFNPGYAELLGKELEMQRMREAENERLIWKTTTWNPPLSRILSVIIRSRWHDLWTGRRKSGQYLPLTHLPKNSPST